jgi:hypothetical protein
LKKVEKIRLSKKILKDLKELSKTLPAVVINNKVYYVTPRALLAENLCKILFFPKKIRPSFGLSQEVRTHTQSSKEIQWQNRSSYSHC